MVTIEIKDKNNKLMYDNQKVILVDIQAAILKDPLKTLTWPSTITDGDTVVITMAGVDETAMTPQNKADFDVIKSAIVLASIPTVDNGVIAGVPDLTPYARSDLSNTKIAMKGWK